MYLATVEKAELEHLAMNVRRAPKKIVNVPAHQRLGLDDRHGLEDRPKPAIQLDEEQAIAIREVNATSHLALQHSQLMEHGFLCLKSAPRLGRRGEHRKEEAEQHDHRR
jgi:hypothetical protein